jgi:murein DD-endopeptidase MepM/ murein hydrolase activator NlpD
MPKFRFSPKNSRLKLRFTPRTALLAAFVVVTGLAGPYFSIQREALRKMDAVPIAAASVAPAPQPSLKEIVGRFQRNQNITDALLEQGISAPEIARLIASTRPVYNLARVAADRPYWVVVNSTGALYGLRYAVDETRYLTVYRDGDEYVPVMKDFPFDRRRELVEGEIHGSLFQAVTDAGESDRLALDLAAIFTYDVDFYTDIQPGDTFRILVEKDYLDGKFHRYGAILAAQLHNGNKEFTGYRFRTSGAGFEYYAADGRSLKKSFLKSPLKFARVTSRFTHARYHPILKVVRPHLGVDYAAPTGTPVVAVASGTVTSAGASGGSGRAVHLRHGEGLETMYLHLSRVLVRPGARVEQGQVVGLVGATGLATGPHLDFRVLRRGRYVNPASLIVPPAPPVGPGDSARFAELRREIDLQLQGSTVVRAAQ